MQSTKVVSSGPSTSSLVSAASLCLSVSGKAASKIPGTIEAGLTNALTRWSIKILDIKVTPTTSTTPERLILVCTNPHLHGPEDDRQYEVDHTRFPRENDQRDLLRLLSILRTSPTFSSVPRRKWPFRQGQKKCTLAAAQAKSDFMRQFPIFTGNASGYHLVTESERHEPWQSDRRISTTPLREIEGSEEWWAEQPTTFAKITGISIAIEPRDKLAISTPSGTIDAQHFAYVEDRKVIAHVLNLANKDWEGEPWKSLQTAFKKRYVGVRYNKGSTRLAKA